MGVNSRKKEGNERAEAIHSLKKKKKVDGMEKERKNLVKVKRKHGVNEKRCFGVFCVCVFCFCFLHMGDHSHMLITKSPQRKRSSLRIKIGDENIYKPVGFPTRGDFAPQETSDNVWRRFWLSKLGNVTGVW